MKDIGYSAMAVISLLSLMALSTLMISDAEGAAILMEEGSISYSPTKPTHDDVIRVNATPMFIDCEPVKVTLKYSLCTETYCGLDIPVDMTRAADSDIWTASIGPFEKTDPSGDQFIDVRFFVTAEGSATDGDTDPTENSETITIYFERKDDDGNGNGEAKRSPLGWEVLAAPLLAAAMLVIINRGRRVSLR
ncbi:MAG: hypothetical protein QCI82_00195 [Candidatus Thermoplasmatota archaeon]|nr:hypothetical protein [Candidatus Thermoplasmatota archaeon]